MVRSSRTPNPSTHAYALVVMARPTFLLGTFPIYLGGIALAASEGYTVQVPTAICGLVLVWVIQSMTHYTNEYCDVETDMAADELSRIAGGSSILASDIVPRRTAYIAGLVLLLLAIGLTLAMTVILEVGFGLLVLAGSAIILGWFYSMPPVALASRGAGEATVAVTVGILVPVTAYYLQTSTISTKLWFLCLPFFVFGFATSLATALPDIDADRHAGKKTLVVQLGRRQAVVLLTSTVITGWISFGYTILIAGININSGMLLAAPLLVMLVMCFAPGAARNSADATEAMAYTIVANLGWVSVSVSTLLV